MSNLSPNHLIQPLSVGDIVSAGVRIFRSNLKRFLILSLIAWLWFLVPVGLLILAILPVAILRPVGQEFTSLLSLVSIVLAIAGFLYACARYSEICGCVSRLAFQDLIHQPESIKQAKQATQPKLWSFFGAGFLVWLIFLGVNIAVIILVLFAIGISRALLNLSSAFGGIISLLVVIGLFVILSLYIRLSARFFIVEVSLAVEENTDATTAISRSWNLTKRGIVRIVVVSIIAFLITLFVNIPTQIFLSFFRLVGSIDSPTIAFAVLGRVMIIVLNNILMMPYWQAIKAVIYYDLRARREGFGLALRDR